jgi:hypothetical protein
MIMIDNRNLKSDHAFGGPRLSKEWKQIIKQEQGILKIEQKSTQVVPALWIHNWQKMGR